MADCSLYRIRHRYALAAEFRPARQTALLGVILCLAFAGCSPWLRPAMSEKSLPTPLLSQETVILEIAFVHLTPDDSVAEDAIWKQLDEQPLPIETRQRLAGNGMRAGLVGTQMPEELRRLVNRTAQELSQAPSGDDVSTAEFTTLARQRRMQVRAGRRGKIVVSGNLPTISVLSKDDQGRVQGDAYTSAQCLFSLLATPQPEARTLLQLTPEIEHGELKNRWVPLDGALVQQVGKDRKVYEHLKVALPLLSGQALLVGPAAETSGVGEHFFTLREPLPRRTLLLVRIAQTQQDELFQQPAQSDAVYSITD